MPATNVHHHSTVARPQDSGVPVRAIVCVVALMAAAWIAAGSIGLLADPLRCVLCWIVLGLAILVDFSGKERAPLHWIGLAAAVVVGLIMTGSSVAAVNVAAVAVVGFALARSSNARDDRPILIAAGAVAMLAVFRLAYASIPTVWAAAEVVGGFLGRLGGDIAGHLLSVGASFGGVDFLVLMAALYAGWLVWSPSPRLARAIYAAGAILVGHLVYLVVLAFCGAIMAALPEPVVRETSDVDLVGVWAWGNSVRAMLPWNVPVLAAVIHAVIAVVMFRWTAWPATNASAVESREKASQRRPFSGPDALLWFAPVVLAALIPLLVALGQNTSKLKQNGGGRAVQRTSVTPSNIVAYKHGYANWRRPEYPDRQQSDQTVKPRAGDYGLLQQFVETLGGDFRIEGDLTRLDRTQVDLLVLIIHPDQPWSKEQTDWIAGFVRSGGSVLVAAEAWRPEHDAQQPAADAADDRTETTSLSRFNKLLAELQTGMQVRDDTVVAAAGHWEHCLEPPTHPIAAGIDRRRNRFALARGCSIETGFAARPLLVGRWAWCDPGSDPDHTIDHEYDSGERLGDIVLAAEQPVGAGRVVVLGDTGALRNDGLPVAYPLIGRLLGYLANKAQSPFSWWRQLLAIAAIVALVGLSIRSAAGSEGRCADPLQSALAMVALSVSLVACTAVTYSAGRVIPYGNVAYIDASHLEAYSNDTWDGRGIGGLTRNLARNGYLPLLLPEISADRLERAEVLICVGPARPFSGDELETVHDYVTRGGSLICMVGAEEASGSANLLNQFQFEVPPTPQPPEIDEPEPTPLGDQPNQDEWPLSFSIVAGDSHVFMQTYAPWEVKCDKRDWTTIAWQTEQSRQRHYVLTRPVPDGIVAVIGDTLFATNGNLETRRGQAAENVRFWRWFLPRVTDLPEWSPPGPAAEAENAPAPPEDQSPQTTPDDKPDDPPADQPDDKPDDRPDKEPATEITPPKDLPPRITPDDVPGGGMELMPFDPLPPRAAPGDAADTNAEEETP